MRIQENKCILPIQIHPNKNHTKGLETVKINQHSKKVQLFVIIFVITLILISITIHFVVVLETVVSELRFLMVESINIIN